MKDTLLLSSLKNASFFTHGFSLITIFVCIASWVAKTEGAKGQKDEPRARHC